MTDSTQSLIDPNAPITRKEFEALKAEIAESKKGQHDMTYKGHDYWNAIRENVRKLASTGPLPYIGVQEDPWMRKESHAQSSEQWRRIRNALILRHPHRNGCPYPEWKDGVEFVDFYVRGRGRPVAYLSLRENLPCDAEVALRAERVAKTRFPQQLRRIRDRYPLDGRTCRCGHSGFEHGSISYSKLDGTSSVLHTGGPPESHDIVSLQQTDEGRTPNAESLMQNPETTPFRITRRSD